MKTQDIFIGIALALSLVALVVSIGTKTEPLGGTTSDYWDAASFKVGGTEVISSSRAATFDTLVHGGDVTVLSSSATTSLTAAQLCDSSIVTWDPTTASGDLTLPTSANVAADCLITDGDSRTFLFRNINSTAATTTQIVAGTGMVLLEPDGQNIEIGGGNSALIHCVRASSTAIVVSVDEMIDAD